tara:strand:- start:936 stop:1784 length:849 start_codon:yes stop_codon:yes gene_type:complete
MIHFPISSPYIIQTDITLFQQVIQIQIAWYGVLFALGVLLSCLYCQRKIPKTPWLDESLFDRLIYRVILGAVIGGKLGYALLYTGLFQPELLLNTLFSRHGMSFHGGLIGSILGIYLFARQHDIDFLTVTDWLAPAVPWGLMLGRLGNFINAELWGRPSDLPWAVLFPNAGPVARHPSQLYEMLLEGLMLGIICHWVSRKDTKQGVNSATFLIGYSVFRIFSEYFREPDAFIGLLFHINLSYGQILCGPMLALGLLLGFKASKGQRCREEDSNLHEENLTST